MTKIPNHGSYEAILAEMDQEIKNQRRRLESMVAEGASTLAQPHWHDVTAETKEKQANLVARLIDERNAFEATHKKTAQKSRNSFALSPVTKLAVGRASRPVAQIAMPAGYFVSEPKSRAVKWRVKCE